MHNPLYQTIIALLTCSGLWTALVELIKWLISRRSGIKKELRDISEDLRSMRDDLKEEKDTRERDKAEGYRNQIVKFNDELLGRTEHSKSMFDMTLLACSNYEHYCEDHADFQNGVASEAIANIRRCYREREVNNSFL